MQIAGVEAHMARQEHRGRAAAIDRVEVLADRVELGRAAVELRAENLHGRGNFRTPARAVQAHAGHLRMARVRGL